MTVVLQGQLTTEEVLRRLFEAGMDEALAVRAGVLFRCSCGAIVLDLDHCCQRPYVPVA